MKPAARAGPKLELKHRMTTETILDITRQALLLVLMLSLPVVLVAACVALVTAVAQAITQVQDQSIGMAARMIAVMVTLILVGGWIGRSVLLFGQQSFARLF